MTDIRKRERPTTAAVITAAQIYTVPGLHVERSDYPVYALNFATGEVTFECWPRFQDVTKPDARQFPGWPVTIQLEK